MDRLAPIIEKTLHNLGFLKEVKSRLSLSCWDEVVGEKIASRTQPVLIQKGILFVKADSSIWAYHLTLVKPTLISKLNQRLGAKVVSDIRFQVGKVEGSTPKGKDLSYSPADEVDVPDSLIASVEEAPPEYREVLTSIIKKSYRWRYDKAKKGWKKCQCCDILVPPRVDLCPTCRYQIGRAHV